MEQPQEQRAPEAHIAQDGQDLVIIDFEDLAAFRASPTTQFVCKDKIKAMFPDICLTYLERVASDHNYDIDAVVREILDREDNGKAYPTQSQDQALKRRKLDDGNHKDHLKDVEAIKQNLPESTKAVRRIIANPGHSRMKESYCRMAEAILNVKVFPYVPVQTLRDYLKTHQHLFETYTAIDEAIRTWDRENPPWKEKKIKTRGTDLKLSMHSLAGADTSHYSPPERAAIVELLAAGDLKAIKDAQGNQAAGEGTDFGGAQPNKTSLCGCCFEEFAHDSMIQCDSNDQHRFCRSCIRRHAETNIGQSKYELNCMSMDGCPGGFFRSQKCIFLDEKTLMALERLEQEDALRRANIENLVNCPFCPYAEEYPPGNTAKEFYCINPECGKVSCRLCRLESHNSKTCEEAAAEKGIGVRHIVEEAMSKAAIRNCNKCQKPFMKESGCNKIVCPNCKTMQCYVCRKTITDYKHFNDVRRGGATGQCPLFESTEKRHYEEVGRAEEEARKQVAENNPDIVADALKITMSERVQQDELKRRRNEAQYERPQNARAPMAHRLAANRLAIDQLIANRPAVNRPAANHPVVNRPEPNRPAVVGRPEPDPPVVFAFPQARNVQPHNPRLQAYGYQIYNPQGPEPAAHVNPADMYVNANLMQAGLHNLLPAPPQVLPAPEPLHAPQPLRAPQALHAPQALRAPQPPGAPQPPNIQQHPRAQQRLRAKKAPAHKMPVHSIVIPLQGSIANGKNVECFVDIDMKNRNLRLEAVGDVDIVVNGYPAGNARTSIQVALPLQAGRQAGNAPPLPALHQGAAPIRRPAPPPAPRVVEPQRVPGAWPVPNPGWINGALIPQDNNQAQPPEYPEEEDRPE